MRNHGKYTCRVCDKEFNYCRKCALVPIKHFVGGFCSENCMDIYAILSKHGCGNATAEETLEALKNCDVSNVSEGIAHHIETLNTEE